jgi:predicted nucleic acid-binding protein
LYPAPLRDLLLQLATANLFRAQWSDEIQEEWINALLRGKKYTREQLNYTKTMMNQALLDANVTDYAQHIAGVTLPDPDDRHVVAAAIKGRADAIVTFNLKDFPAAALAPFNLEAIHPDDFITHQFDIHEAAVIQAATTICRRLKNPPKTGKDYLDTLLQQRLPKTVALLRPYEAVICPFGGSSGGNPVN